MKVLSPEEVEERFGLSPDEVAELEREAAKGVLHGGPCGEVVRGRPFMFGAEMRQVGFKEPLGVVDAIDRRAGELGMRRSDYLRSLVEADLAGCGSELAEKAADGSTAPVVKALRGKRASEFWDRWRKRVVFEQAGEGDPGTPVSVGVGEGGHAHTAR